MHEDYLSKICKESGLSGLDYFGGPQVICRSCDWEEVVPCVVYKSEDVRQVEDLQTCAVCGEDLNIEQWLVSANIYRVSYIRNLLLFFPHSPTVLQQLKVNL